MPHVHAYMYTRIIYTQYVFSNKEHDFGFMVILHFGYVK